jgi:hypothetical protein
VVGAEVDPDAELWHIQLRTRLTTIKLGLQMLQRRPGLLRDPGGPMAKALEAVDALTRELAERERTPR